MSTDWMTPKRLEAYEALRKQDLCHEDAIELSGVGTGESQGDVIFDKANEDDDEKDED